MSSETDEGSAVCSRLRDEYRKHVLTQISKDLTETISAMQQHRDQLLTLTQQLEQARIQVTESTASTVDQINKTFDQLLVVFNQAVTQRRKELLAHVVKMENESLEPLEECGEMLRERLQKAESKLEEGHRLHQHQGGALAKDTIIRFQEEAASMTSLPEVPVLCAVPCISVEFPKDPPLTTQIREIVETAGSLSRMGPVQITNLEEKPGALLITWEEVEDDVGEDGTEFCLQVSLAGCKDWHTATFSTVYEGTEYSFLLRDLKTGVPYVLRVASRREGTADWGPWSLPQTATTHKQHFCWGGKDCNWSLADEGRLASKLTSEPVFLFSQGPQIKPGTSALFRVLHLGAACGDEGIGLVAKPESMREGDLLQKGVFYVNARGQVFLDGVAKVTRLPKLCQGAHVSFTVEQVAATRVRVHIENQDKQVTYEWVTECPEEGFYFVMNFVEPEWRISVH